MTLDRARPSSPPGRTPGNAHRAAGFLGGLNGRGRSRASLPVRSERSEDIRLSVPERAEGVRRDDWSLQRTPNDADFDRLHTASRLYLDSARETASPPLVLTQERWARSKAANVANLVNERPGESRDCSHRESGTRPRRRPHRCRPQPERSRRSGGCMVGRGVFRGVGASPADAVERSGAFGVGLPIAHS